MSFHYEPGRGRITLTVLSAAIGAGFAGSAEAAFISTAGSAGLPVSFDTTASSKSLGIDLNGDGTVDYTISSQQGGNIEIAAGTNLVGTFANYMSSFTSLADFVPADTLKANSGVVPISTLSGSTYAGVFSSSPGFAELVFQGATPQEHFIGYLAGSLDIAAGTTAVFTLTDFGFDSTPLGVPEPGSLALLAAGAAGLAAFRRRRAELAA